MQEAPKQLENGEFVFGIAIQRLLLEGNGQHNYKHDHFCKSPNEALMRHTFKDITLHIRTK